MYFIAFYAPPEHTDNIKQALFTAGAGRIGNYACCAWQTTGTGQFMPLDTAKPFIGDIGRVEKTTEVRVEMVCDDAYIQEVIRALHTVHPYETPAFQVIRLESFTTSV